jgi:ribosomal protein S12 methylthiotransferase accessory factor YcaO
MLNLAPWRYRHIFAEQGGPITRIEFSEFPVLGHRCFQANAYLAPQLTGKPRPQLNLYSNADGTGTHPSAMVARYMAISEALERWAFHVKVNDFDRDLYGFDRDTSSNGMAAFPGLVDSQCRMNAYWEALERFCVISWWDGRLAAKVRPTEWTDVMAAQIEHPLGQGVMVILFKRCMPGDFFSYGHAAGRDFKAACQKASIELCRNEYVLRSYRATHPSFTNADLPQVNDIFERRLLFFSLPAGHALFQDRLKSAPRAPIASPNVMFDGPIFGPWSRYATVWRVALELPTQWYLEPTKQEFFFW